MKNRPFGNEIPEGERNLEQALKHSLHQTPSAAGDAHLQATIWLARREACLRQSRKRISFGLFLRKQIPRIGWKLWSIQGVFLLLSCGLLFNSVNDMQSPRYLAKLLFSLSIAVSMTSLPMLYRCVRYRMQEIEASSRFSSVKLLLAKLIVIGIGDLFLLGGIFLTALANASLPADITVIYLCFPFLLSCSGCLFMLGHLPPGQFLSGSLLFCTALMLVFAVLPGQYALLFHPSFFAVRIILCVLLTAFCAYQLRYIIKISPYGEMQLI